jgi:ribosomal protein S18 acetylase RimI-like enzyme
MCAGLRSCGSREVVASVMSRVASNEQDLLAATEVMTTAFANDPVWGGWAFPDPDPVARNLTRERFWHFVLQSGMRYPWVRLSDDDDAATLWIPPGGRELTDAEESQIDDLLEELVGDHAEAFLECLGLFESSHPRDEPHYYLSLLGVHDRSRGRGAGIALLSENLAIIDVEGLPCYLESTNPANLRRYESVGFAKVGEFTLPKGGPTVDTMWREGRPPRP